MYPLETNKTTKTVATFRKGKFYTCVVSSSACFTVGKAYLCCNHKSVLGLVDNDGDFLKVQYLSSKFEEYC